RISSSCFCIAAWPAARASICFLIDSRSSCFLSAAWATSALTRQQAVIDTTRRRRTVGPFGRVLAYGHSPSTPFGTSTSQSSSVPLEEVDHVPSLGNRNGLVLREQHTQLRAVELTDDLSHSRSD